MLEKALNLLMVAIEQQYPAPGIEQSAKRVRQQLVFWRDAPSRNSTSQDLIIVSLCLQNISTMKRIMHHGHPQCLLFKLQSLRASL